MAFQGSPGEAPLMAANERSGARLRKPGTGSSAAKGRRPKKVYRGKTPGRKQIDRTAGF